jgi:hypothetical protein
MTNDAGYELLFLPWADLGRTYHVGPFALIPWSEFQLNNAQLKAHLDNYFSRHVSHLGNPVKGIAVLWHPQHELQPMAYLPHERPADVVNVFLFATIGPTVEAAVADDNPNHAPPTADRYALVRQNFRVGDEEVVVHSGGTRHAARINALTFPQPWDLGGTSFPDEDVLSGFGQVFDPAFASDVRDRLFRALEWFRLAHVGGDSTSDFSRAVMMATAFEILFQLGDRPGKTNRFIREIESRLTTPRALNDTRSVPIVVGKKAGKTKTVTRSMPGWWADSFYDLRSRVVHGDEVEPRQLQYSGWITHLVVADVVFWQCIKRELYDRGLIGVEIRRLKADPAYATMTPLLEEQLFGLNAHKTLKWTALVAD